MPPSINKFIVAAVTALSAAMFIIQDGIVAEEWIALVILFSNALGVYAVPNVTLPTRNSARRLDVP